MQHYLMLSWKRGHYLWESYWDTKIQLNTLRRLRSRLPLYGQLLLAIQRVSKQQAKHMYTHLSEAAKDFWSRINRQKRFLFLKVVVNLHLLHTTVYLTALQTSSHAITLSPQAQDDTHFATMHEPCTGFLHLTSTSLLSQGVRRNAVI